MSSPTSFWYLVLPMGLSACEQGVPRKFVNLNGDIQGTKAYKFIGFGDIQGTKAYKFIGFGDIQGPKPSWVD